MAQTVLHQSAELGLLAMSAGNVHGRRGLLCSLFMGEATVQALRTRMRGVPLAGNIWRGLLTWSSTQLGPLPICRMDSIVAGVFWSGL